MEKIGIVLLNYNDFESVFDFIRFVEPYSNIIELALVDNNSTDGSYEKFLEFNKKWIHVIKAQSNNGYASGNNLGLRYLALNFPNIKQAKYNFLASSDGMLKMSLHSCLLI